MSTDSLTVHLNCLICGGIPTTDDDSVTDSSIVKCKSCGQVFGTFAEVKAKAIEAAKAEVIAKLKSGFDQG